MIASWDVNILLFSFFFELSISGWTDDCMQLKRLWNIFLMYYLMNFLAQCSYLSHTSFLLLRVYKNGQRIHPVRLPRVAGQNSSPWFCFFGRWWCAQEAAGACESNQPPRTYPLIRCQQGDGARSRRAMPREDAIGLGSRGQPHDRGHSTSWRELDGETEELRCVLLLCARVLLE